MIKIEDEINQAYKNYKKTRLDKFIRGCFYKPLFEAGYITQKLKVVEDEARRNLMNILEARALSGGKRTDRMKFESAKFDLINIVGVSRIHIECRKILIKRLFDLKVKEKAKVIISSELKNCLP